MGMQVTYEDAALFQEIAAAADALVASGPPVMDKHCLICFGYLRFGHNPDCKWERLRRACEADQSIETTDAPPLETTALIPKP